MSALYRSATAEQAVRSWCTSRLDGWGTPHRTAWLDTSLGRTHVVEAGAGDSTCVFLPGTNFNASTSLPLLDALAARFTVYAADLPGQPGLSAAARPRAEREGYARWIDDVLTEVRSRSRTVDEPGRSRQVVLVGHSRGAAVALSARGPKPWRDWSWSARPDCVT